MSSVNSRKEGVSGRRVPSLGYGSTVAYAICAVAFMAAAPAAAQEVETETSAEDQPTAIVPQTPPSTNPEVAAASAGDNDIVVTAQRRSERLVDVPASVVAANAELLEQTGVRSLADLNNVAAGVQVNNNGAFTNPTIRGITTLTNGGAFDNNVAVYVDGFYVPDMVTVASDFGNIESVQVLKGPQGALYGRNATGGAIIITTLAPSDVLTGRANIGYAEFDELTLGGYISGPIAKGLSFSIAGYQRESDGYYRLASPTTIGETIGDAAPQLQRNLRLKLLAELTDNFSVTLAYNYARMDDIRGNLYTPFDHIPAFLGSPPSYPTDVDHKAFNGEQVLRGVTDEGTITAKLDTSIGQFTSYTGYGDRDSVINFDFDGTYRDVVRIDIDINTKTFQQTLIYNANLGDSFDLVAGAEYYWDERKNFRPVGTTTISNGVVVSRSYPEVEAEALSGFVDGTYKATEALTISAGARYSRETKSGFQFAESGAGVVIFPATENEKTWKAFTPRASIRYELAPRTNVYAAYSKGFRAGAFTFSTPARPDLFLPINPEKATAYEVGFKMARRAVRFEVAGYLNKYKDIHVGAAVLDPLCTVQPCAIRILTINGPSAEIFGVDASVDVTLAEGLNARASGTYLHARYGTFTNATGTGLNAATDLNIPGQTQDWTDQQMARAPDFSANAGIDYTMPTSVGDFRAAANARFSTSFVPSNPSLFGPLAGAELADKQRYRSNGFVAVNAEIMWTSPSQAFSVTAFVRNLTNTRYFEAYSGLNFGDYGFRNAPRQFGARASYSF